MIRSGARPHLLRRRRFSGITEARSFGHLRDRNKGSFAFNALLTTACHVLRSAPPVLIPRHVLGEPGAGVADRSRGPCSLSGFEFGDAEHTGADASESRGSGGTGADHADLRLEGGR